MGKPIQLAFRFGSGRKHTRNIEKKTGKPKPAHTIPLPGQEREVLLDNARILREGISKIVKPPKGNVLEQAHYISKRILADLGRKPHKSRIGLLKTALEHNQFLGVSGKKELMQKLELLERVRKGAIFIAGGRFTALQAKRFVELAGELIRLFPEELEK